jgi:hypothetical protein
MIALEDEDKTTGKGSTMGKPTVATVTVDVDVTPVDQSGQIVICDIDPTSGGKGGAHVDDGVIFLAADQDYQIDFHLKNGGNLGQYTWDSDPFWAKKSKCPDRSGMPNGQFPNPPTVNGNVLSVGAKGVPGRSAVHFRLNLTDAQGNSAFCDPIIINN